MLWTAMTPEPEPAAAALINLIPGPGKVRLIPLVRVTPLNVLVTDPGSDNDFWAGSWDPGAGATITRGPIGIRTFFNSIKPDEVLISLMAPLGWLVVITGVPFWMVKPALPPTTMFGLITPA